MIFQTPELNPKEVEVVQQIDELKQSLQYLVNSTPRRWSGVLRRNTFARNVQGSNSIEGFNVSEEDAIAAVEGEQPLDASTEAWQAVTGYQAAMTFVLQLAKDPRFVYTEHVLRGLHFMMVQHDLGKNPGLWRPGSIYVKREATGEIVYEGPDAEQVPGLIAELVAALNEPNDRVPGMVRAAMAHLNLVMIHPFSDGNGRMARCLQSMVLTRTGTLAVPFASIEEYLGANTGDYYRVLGDVGGGAWHPERDASPWVRFCLTAHFRQATTIQRRANDMNRLWDALEVEISARKLPARTIFALADAAIGFRVRNATYRTAAETTNDLASRDLRELVDAGLLVAEGERRGRVYVASDVIKELRQRTATRRLPIPDPFAKETGQQPLDLGKATGIAGVKDWT